MEDILDSAKEFYKGGVHGRKLEFDWLSLRGLQYLSMCQRARIPNIWLADFVPDTHVVKSSASYSLDDLTATCANLVCSRAYWLNGRYGPINVGFIHNWNIRWEPVKSSGEFYTWYMIFHTRVMVAHRGIQLAVISIVIVCLHSPLPLPTNLGRHWMHWMHLERVYKSWG
jgi:hypothetical protein